MPTKLAAGNWKMNGTRASLDEIARLRNAHPAPGVDVVVCPPATLITSMVAAMDNWGAVGGQDCHAAASGAHTGDIAAGQLADAGAGYVILGHSERRADHGENDLDVSEKVTAAWAAGLIAILCVGETLAQREAGDYLDLIADQLLGSLPNGATPENLVVAYEPVWAIGTGQVASPEQIAEVHTHLAARLADQLGAALADNIRLLYGGSVKPGNAAEIFAIPHVHGALVGGASLKAEDFGAIVSALAQS